MIKRLKDIQAPQLPIPKRRLKKSNNNELSIQPLLKIANDYMNGDIESSEDVKRRLMAWFCFTYNTTLNDNRLLDMTVEDLLLHYHMHRIKNNPSEVEEELNPATQNYEDWLKEEMGDDYLTDDQMIEDMEKEEQTFQKKIIKKYPDRIVTDFDNTQEGS